MRVFTRVVEQRSFTRTAAEMQLPRASVTHAIQSLESRLGLRLLQRTTRQVSPTPEGEAYYERCVRLLADFDDAEALGVHGGTQPRGRLRVDMHPTVAALVVLPALAGFLDRYPGISVEIGTGDRPVDLVREGVDCVLRGGTLKDSSLVARKLADMTQVTCASPGYLARHGTPAAPTDLQAGHFAVNYLSSADGQVWDMAFVEDGEQYSLSLPSRVSVSSTDAYVSACLAGLGLIQLPRYGMKAHLEAGRLTEVLASYRPAPMPIWALYPHARQLSPRVRVFVDWVAGVLVGV